MKVSVIIPVYNKAPYVAGAVASVLDQSYSDFELIIIDDGSTDGSQEIIKKNTDPRIRFYQNTENTGTAKIGNKLIELANTEYILRLDADDLMLPGRIAAQIDFMEKNPELTVSSGALTCFGSSDDTWYLDEFHDILWSKVLFKSPINQPAGIIRKSHWLKFNFSYNENSPNLGEDWLLWFKIALKSKVGNLKIPLVKYRMEGQNITNSRDKKYFNSRDFLYSHMLDELGITKEYLDVHILTKPEFNGIPNKSHIKRFFEWMNVLLDYNRKCKIFKEELFEMEILHRKNQLFFYLMKVNRKLIRTFFYYNRGLNLNQSRYYFSSVIRRK